MAKEDKRIEEAAVDQSAGVAPVDKPEAGRIKKSGKKGKKFATKDSMLSILNQVSGIEEMRLEKKMKRQQVVKSLTKEKEKKSMERKSKIGRKLDDMKAKLLEKTVQKRRAKKQAKKSPGKAGLSRTLSAINREWDSDEIASGGSDALAGVAKPKKTVSFAM